MRYKLSPRATNDEREIFDYYLECAGLEIATRIYFKIEHAIMQLADNPHLGHIEPTLEDFSQSFR